MKKTLNRIISVFLFAVFVLSTYHVPTLADADSALTADYNVEGLLDSFNTNEKEVIQNEIQDISSLGILSIGTITKIGTDEQDASKAPFNQHIYTIDYGEIVNEITYLNTISDDSVCELLITQGDVKDVLVVKNNGDFYLDGNKVDISTDYSFSSDEEDLPTRSVGVWFKTPPYGSPSSYQYYLRTEACSNISYYQELYQTTFTTFFSLFFAGLQLNFFYNLTTVFSDAAQALYVDWVNYYPTTTASSCMAPVYTVYNGTALIDSTYGYCYKYYFDFYPYASYGGHSTRAIWYYEYIPSL